MKKRYLGILIPILILFFLLFRFVAEIGTESFPNDRFRVVDIIDGDTIELAGHDHVRLLGIDCPEKGELYHDSAEIYVENMLQGNMIDIKYSARKRDGYGRILGYIYLDSTFINAELIRRGLAHAYIFEDNLGDKETIEKLLKAQRDGIKNRTGLWGRIAGNEPYYLAKPGSYRFHRPNCKSIRKSDAASLMKFANKIDAFNEGYSPCRNCKP